MTDDQIKHMVNRFLGWKLPESFKPDAGISFTRQWHMNFGGSDRIPSHPFPMPLGTNLFDAMQADAMVRYMVEEMPQPSERPVAQMREALEKIANAPAMFPWARDLARKALTAERPEAEMIQADSIASEKVCDHPSTEKAVATAWAVRRSDGAIFVKTISDTRRAAIVNWLVVEKALMIYSHHSDAEIEAMWKHHGIYVDCRVVYVHAASYSETVIANPANSLRSLPESSEPSLLGRETVREALIKAKCCSPDGTYVHASTEQVVRALSPLKE